MINLKIITDLFKKIPLKWQNRIKTAIEISIILLLVGLLLCWNLKEIWEINGKMTRIINTFTSINLALISLRVTFSKITKPKEPKIQKKIK
jgi:hypothetical protein